MLEEIILALTELQENGIWIYEDEKFPMTDFDGIVDLIQPMMKSLKMDFEIRENEKTIELF